MQLPTWGADLIRLNTRVGTILMASGPVIAARLTHFATDANSSVSRREATGMVSEKVEAAQKAGLILAQAWTKTLMTSPRLLTDPQGANTFIKNSLVDAHRALAPYEKKVLANRKRLG